MVEYAHNTLPVSSTGLSPFECSVGYQPPIFPSLESEVAVPSAHALSKGVTAHGLEPVRLYSKWGRAPRSRPIATGLDLPYTSSVPKCGFQLRTFLSGPSRINLLPNLLARSLSPRSLVRWQSALTFLQRTGEFIPCFMFPRSSQFFFPELTRQPGSSTAASRRWGTIIFGKPYSGLETEGTRIPVLGGLGRLRSGGEKLGTCPRHLGSLPYWWLQSTGKGSLGTPGGVPRRRGTVTVRKFTVSLLVSCHCCLHMCGCARVGVSTRAISTISVPADFHHPITITQLQLICDHIYTHPWSPLIVRSLVDVRVWDPVLLVGVPVACSCFMFLPHVPACSLFIITAHEIPWLTSSTGLFITSSALTI